MLTDNVKAQIKQHALSEQTEVCGLIVFADNKADLLVFPSPNKITGDFFQISGREYLKASLHGEIIGYYHSHLKSPVFSELDKTVAEGHKLRAILYHVPTDTFQSYEPGNCQNKYIGREFKIGTQDCFTIIRDYYLNELKIEIKDYGRDADWFTTAPDSYDANYTKEGFINVFNGSYPESHILRQHDCVLFQFLPGNHASHAAIFLKPNHILHHPRHGYSRVEEYSMPYQKRTCYILRHKSLI